MDKNYKKIYQRYSLLLYRALRSSGTAYFALDLSKHGLSAEEQDRLKRVFITRTGYDADGEAGGTLSLSLAEYLDYFYLNKKKLLKDLRMLVSLKKEISSKDRYAVEKLIKAINSYIEDVKALAQTLSENEDEADLSQLEPQFIMPFDYGSQPDNVLWLSRQRTFVLNKELDEDYFPTKASFVNTSKFDDLSQEDLEMMFLPDQFYKLNKEDVHALLQALANNYLSSYGVEPCAVMLDSLPIDDNHIQFGEYDPNQGAISMNKKLVDLFDEGKQSKNINLPMQLYTTLIHECRHRVQYSLYNCDSLNEKNDAIVSALKNPSGETPADYLGSLDEIDARNEALKYVRLLAERSDDPKLKAYYNQRKSSEQSNGKRSIDQRQEAYFSEVYGSHKFQTASNTQSDSEEFSNMLHGSSSGVSYLR